MQNILYNFLLFKESFKYEWEYNGQYLAIPVILLSASV